MSKNKKFFWLKLKEDFFESDEIKILESLPNGMAYSNFYLKLLCKSIKNNGVLRLRNVIPYTVEMLSSMTNTNIDIARGAIEKLIALNMIEVLDDGALYMLDIENMIGSETDSAQRMREARAKTINLISIHAPTKGATTSVSIGSFSYGKFQSTPPQNGRPQSMHY